MPFFEIFLLAISMAMDAFAVCLAAGSLRQTRGARPAFRLSFHFGLFQFIMPVLGWLAGATLAPITKGYDHWVVFGLLGIFVWYPAIFIGVVTGLLSLLGLRLGHVLGRRFGRSVEIIGGLVLIAVGSQIVISSLV